jgi:serine/threonine-protein kinase
MAWRRRSSDETLVAPPPAPGAPPPPVPPPREWWPWLLALLILVLGGLVAGYLLTRDDDESAGGPTTAATTATTATTSATTAQAVDVPNVVGQRSTVAVERLRSLGLEPVVRNVFSTRPNGVVVAQDPKPPATVDPGTSVRLDVSRGTQEIEVPDVVGSTEQEALDALRTAGFEVATFDVPSAQPEGAVVAQNPAAGTKADSGSRVRINVSTGSRQGGTTQQQPAPPPPATPPAAPPPPATPATVTVPDLVGQNRTTAAQQIRSLGLKVTIRYVPSSEPVGTVVSQSPAAGSTRKRGEGVLINLSFGPDGEQTAKPVPGVVGKDEQTARSTLEGAGFAVEVWRLRVSRASQNGIVVDEQPGAGQRAPAGSTVTITVGSTSG